MTSKERIAQVFAGELPDRVPLAELGIRDIIIEALGVEGGQMEAFDFLGLDLFVLWAGDLANRQSAGDNREIDEFGRLWSIDPWFYLGGALETPRDLERFDPPHIPEVRITDQAVSPIR